MELEIIKETEKDEGRRKKERKTTRMIFGDNIILLTILKLKPEILQRNKKIFITTFQATETTCMTLSIKLNYTLYSM